MAFRLAQQEAAEHHDGHEGTQLLLASTHVFLKDLVPEDHSYRCLEECLGLSFVREFVAPLYAGGGRPSVEPVVFFRLLLYWYIVPITP